jgi:prevent-host-death family protein
MTSWGIAALKARASEVVEGARTMGPQEITRNGKPVAVMIGIEEYKRSSLSKPKKSLVEFFRRSPAYGIDLDIKRVPLHPRKVEF